jgi:hypothetical protein
MHAFSAADSVSLAVQRTREFLFRPFNWGTYLKLGLVAIITEGVGSSLRSSSRGGHPSGAGPTAYPPFNTTPGTIAVAVAGSLLALFVAMVAFYLVTRLRFAFFHCLINNTKEIRPGWQIYREPATRFFWLNVVVGLCFMLLVVSIALPFAAGFWRLFRGIPPGGHPDIGLLLGLVLPLLPIILLLVLAAVLIDLILRDWILPHFALENATAGEAWGSVWASINAEAKQFFVYVLLRVALPIVAMAVLFIVLIIPGLALAGSIGAIEYGIHSAFADSTGGAAVTGVILQGFFGVVALGLLLLVSVCLGGPVGTGIREYALMFYGGRYQTLGDILYPPAPQPPPQTAAPKFA